MDREKKTVEICVRVTPTEKKELQEKADAVHLSLSRYLVKSGSDHKMLQTQNIARLIYEIRKIGININQIAHVANGQRFILRSDLVSLNRHMDAVVEITKKILKATYDEKEANIKTLERKSTSSWRGWMFMATVKSVKSAIKSSDYVAKSISYILLPETKSGNEKCVQSSFINCCYDSVNGLVTEFDITRFAYHKNDKILAHHYVQSFSPNENISPELAHKIGEELAECVAPGFQLIVATHVDRDHIHNHFLINSVSLETGSKWLGNQATLKNLREQSDRICRQYGLSVIDETTELRGIDRATQKLAKQGKSWKVELCHALDEAKKLCYSKDAFIEFMRNKGFIITRYTDRHITFQKIGEEKKIRADTLAKQFGDYYKKENLERIMGFYSIPKPLTPREAPKPQKSFVSEFEKYEKVYFQKNPPPVKPIEAATMKLLIKNSTKPLFIFCWCSLR